MNRLLRNEALRRRLHDRLMTRVGQEGTVLLAMILIRHTGNFHISVKGLGCAKALALDLMTDRARDAVLGEGVLVMLPQQRQAGEDLRLLSFSLVDEVLCRHMTARAFILDIGAYLWMINGLAPNAALPVRISR